MDKRNVPVLLCLIIMAILFSSCQVNTDGVKNSQIEESIDSNSEEPTLEEKESMRSAIEAAVRVVQQDRESRALPEMVDENYMPLNEWSMVKMIERESLAAIDSAANIPNLLVSASYDENVSDEEIINIAVACSGAKTDIENVVFMLDIYTDAYQIYADEAIVYILDLKSELMNIYAQIYFVEEIIFQGEETVNADLVQYNDAAIDMKSEVDSSIENCTQLMNQYTGSIKQWVEEWNAIEPNVQISEPIQIFDLLDEYIEIIYDCTIDEALDHDEIEKIIQAGINAKFAIDNYGDDDIEPWSESITKVNLKAMYGDAMDLRWGMKNFKALLPSIKENYQ